MSQKIKKQYKPKHSHVPKKQAIALPHSMRKGHSLSNISTRACEIRELSVVVSFANVTQSRTTTEESPIGELFGSS